MPPLVAFNDPIQELVPASLRAADNAGLLPADVATRAGNEALAQLLQELAPPGP